MKKQHCFFQPVQEKRCRKEASIGAGEHTGGYLRDEEQCQRHGDRDMCVDEEQQQCPVRVQGRDHDKPREGPGRGHHFLFPP